MTLDNFHYNDRTKSIEQFTDEILSKIKKRIDEIRFTCNNDFETETCERIKKEIQK